MGNEEKKYIVYKTTNLVNGKIYIGVHATETPYEFDDYLGSGFALNKAINKYGKENFKRETLFIFDTETESYAKESELVDTSFIKRKDTYNMCGGGRGVGSGENHPWWGRNHTEETRGQMSKSAQGRVFSKSHREKIRQAKVGTKASIETRQCLSLLQRGENNGMFGKTHTKEVRDILRQSMLERLKVTDPPMQGRKHSLQSRVKMSKTRLGGEVVFYKRWVDVWLATKATGWQTKLAKKWGVGKSSVDYFWSLCQEIIADADCWGLLENWNTIEESFEVLEELC